VILPATDHAAAELVAERIRRGIASMVLEPGIYVTVSLGLESTVVTSAEGARDLVRRADMNLYAAKTGGRNQVHSGQRLPI
jgi:diguanylate cyclase (GGDEF)-like protein